MTFYKLLAYDIRRGLFRKRYCSALAFIVLLCISCFGWMYWQGNSGSVMDYLFYFLMGKEPVFKGKPNELIELPMQWLALLSCHLLLTLDFLTEDLTTEGQQLLFRCQKRTKWLVSKLLWGLIETVWYFLIIIFTTVVFLGITKGKITFSATPDTISSIYDKTALLPITIQTEIFAVLLAMLTAAAYNILQMTLSLFVKPALAFMICLALLVLSIYINSPYMLGNGAMLLRSGLMLPYGQNPWQTAAAAITIIVVCFLISIRRFRYMDILGK